MIEMLQEGDKCIVLFGLREIKRGVILNLLDEIPNFGLAYNVKMGSEEGVYHESQVLDDNGKEWVEWTVSSKLEDGEVVECLHKRKIEVMRYDKKYCSFNPKSIFKDLEWSLGTKHQEYITHYRKL